MTRRATRSYFSFEILLLLLFVCALSGSNTAGHAEGSAVMETAGTAVQLLDGADPMDVVRTVEMNRNRPALEPPSAALNDMSFDVDPTDSQMPVAAVGPAFFIGKEPTYGLAGGNQQAPVVAFDGTNYLVVWQDERSSFGYVDIYGARVGGDGTVLDPGGIAVSTGLTYKQNPAVAFNGTDYLVVWQEGSIGSPDIHGARVSVDGLVLDATGIAISTASSYQQYPSVASDGANCLVAWEDGRNGSRDIYAARVNGAGGVLDASGIAVYASAYDQESPSVAFDGTNYLVVWHDGRNGSRDIYGARVATDGSVLDASGIQVNTWSYDQQYAAVAFDGTNYMVVWEDNRSGSRDIYGARVDVDGAVLDAGGIAISTAAFDQLDPELAFDGTNYLVTWEDNRSGSRDIYGARVATDGSVLDALGMAISTLAHDERGASVAFDGTNYMVVRQDDSFGFADIYGARLAVDGSVLDADGISISTAAYNQRHPAVAYDGTNYLVVWHDGRPGGDPYYWDIYGARVAADGTLIDTSGIAICTVPLSQKYPAVAFNGTDYLVVWQDDRSGTSSDIYGARIAVDGSVLDPDGMAISTASYDQRYPAMSFDGTNCLVVWEDERNSGTWDIYGARVAVDGTVLDPTGFAVCTVIADQYRPAVAFDGIDYLVVWHDFRASPDADIFGARVAADGSLLDPSGIGISTAAEGQYVPAVAFNKTSYLVVWHDERSGDAYDIYGARVRVDGSVLDPAGIEISSAVGNQYSAAIAFNGTDCLVVWEDGRTGAFDIFGTRVDTAGMVLDVSGMPISTASRDQSAAALAFGPSCSCLITYESFMSPPVYDTYRIWGNIWSGPTPLTFASASASAKNGCAELSWEMGVEVTASSFSIQRAEKREGPFGELDVDVYRRSEHSFSCVDCSVVSGKTYWYRIVLRGLSGDEAYGPIEVTVSPVPVASKLGQNYPNPFNPFCVIQYEVAFGSRASMRVFDPSGSVVRTLFDAWREPGVYSETWDGRADDGRELPSGVYFYRLECGDFSAVRKMVLLR